MNAMFAWMLTGTVAWLLLWGFARPERMYQFPFLAGAITFSFILPQMPALADDMFLPPDAFAKTIGFTVLCLLACRLGWAAHARPFRFLEAHFDEQRLLAVAALFSLAGAYFYFQLSRLPGDLTVGVQMSGVPVIYLFFGRLLSYGLGIALLCAARRPSLAACAIILFDATFYFDRIVVTGKRAEAAELVLMVLLAIWFYRRWVIPRIVVLVSLLAGTVLMTSMSDYRDITRAEASPKWSEVASIDVWTNFTEQLQHGGLELRNAVLRINDADATMAFDYGTFHWNTLVFNYVPAQLFGAEFKDSLMVQPPPRARDYHPSTGTTETGMADAFQSFWYLGFIKFLLLAMVVRRIWESAVMGWAGGQLLYMFTAVPATHAISHTTDWVLSVWMHMALFVLPALLFALSPRRRGAPALPARRGAGGRAIPEAR